MELASMLAGEPFGDSPACVCPVIGAFLRSYNDCLDSRRRQDLYPYAAKVVGSRVPKRFQLERVRRLAQWGLELEPRAWWHWVVPLRWRCVARRQSVLPLVVGRTIAAIRAQTDAHPKVLALIDELLAIRPVGSAVAAEWNVGDAVVVGRPRSDSVGAPADTAVVA
jgi:hypothetical protein